MIDHFYWMWHWIYHCLLVVPLQWKKLTSLCVSYKTIYPTTWAVNLSEEETNREMYSFPFLSHKVRCIKEETFLTLDQKSLHKFRKRNEKHKRSRLMTFSVCVAHKSRKRQRFFFYKKGIKGTNLLTSDFYSFFFWCQLQ